MAELRIRYNATDVQRVIERRILPKSCFKKTEDRKQEKLSRRKWVAFFHLHGLTSPRCLIRRPYECTAMRPDIEGDRVIFDKLILRTEFPDCNTVQSPRLAQHKLPAPGRKWKALGKALRGCFPPMWHEDDPDT